MKFSIITATYNSDTTIADNIISVNNQTHKDIEHIFIDNVSSDKTLDIIKNNSNRGTKIHSKKDLGMYYALNQGIDLASGDIIGILNSDDIYYNPKIINEVSSVFLKHNCDIVWGNVIIIRKIVPIFIVFTMQDLIPLKVFNMVLCRLTHLFL